MLDAEGAANFWKQVHEEYVKPEIEKREKAGLLPENFKIYQLRVLMPKDGAAIVEFNSECGWKAKAERGDGQNFLPGTSVYLHELKRVESVEAPEINGERVAFIFFGWDGTEWRGCFDFLPNWTEEQRIAQGIPLDKNWGMDGYLTQFLQDRLEEQSARVCFTNIEVLRQFGLWIVPALIPYPLTEIVQLLNQDEAAARELLVKHCSTIFLSELIETWWEVDEFESRRTLIEEAFWAHKEKKFHLSVSTLLPHLEGIITHWEVNRTGANARFKTESRIKDFKNQTKSGPKSPFLYESVQDTTTNFILNGPVLSTFQNWQDIVDPAFPNRHAVGHGRYDSSLFTEETSVKVFLLLDTIRQLIAAQGQEISNS